jgi:hypothetical protein
MNRRTVTPHVDSPNDVGTLWTMRRLGFGARCALIARPGEWEIRVLVDGQILLAQRRPRGNEAFALAARLKGRMVERGWEQIVPVPPCHPRKLQAAS